MIGLIYFQQCKRNNHNDSKSSNTQNKRFIITQTVFNKNRISMIETELNLPVNAEEHEMINVALTHLLNAADEMMDNGFQTTDNNERINLLRSIRDKSYNIWAQRFPN